MNRRQIAIARSMNRLALEQYARRGITPTVAPIRDWGDLSRTYPNESLLPRRMPAECGTPSGYKRHIRDSDEPCVACREAHATHNRMGTGTLLGRRAA